MDDETENGTREIATIDDAVLAAFASLEAPGAVGSGESSDAAARAAAEQLAAASAAGDPTNTPGQTPAAPAAPADQVATVPDGWTEADQAALDALSPEAKALLDRRVSALTAEHQGKAEAATLGEGIRQLVDDGLRAKLQASGMDEIAGIRHLIGLEHFASTDPAGYLRFVVQQVGAAGVDVAGVLGLASTNQQPASAQEPDPFRDPRLDGLERTVGGLQSHLQAQEHERQRQAAAASVQTFRDARDEAGNLRHPHHAAVTAEMGQILQANSRLTLEQAYEQAVWMNPTVRQSLADAEIARRQAQAQATADARARQEAADAARGARLNVKPGGKALKPNPESNSLDDAIASAMRQVNA